jgi:hypothetical protein
MQAVCVPGISEAKRTVLASVAIWRRDGVSAVSGIEGSMSTDTTALGWVSTLQVGAIDARPTCPAQATLACEGPHLVDAISANTACATNVPRGIRTDDVRPRRKAPNRAEAGLA